MAFKMKRSPLKGVKVKPRADKVPRRKKEGPVATVDYSSKPTAKALSRQSLKQRYMRSQLTVKKK
tara:strand:- start:683 stop:877 length:195 start_codon:yes stop_codon:yes gene_type:complete